MTILEALRKVQEMNPHAIITYDGESSWVDDWIAFYEEMARGESPYNQEMAAQAHESCALQNNGEGNYLIYVPSWYPASGRILVKV